MVGRLRGPVSFEPYYFCYTFGQKYVTDLRNGFLLAFFKISCCLLVYFVRFNILKTAGWTL